MKKLTMSLFALIQLLGATAFAQPGNWMVDGSKYQYNMTATAQIVVDGTTNQLLNNYLAVFYRGQIRGYAVPIRINGQACYFLSMFSNQYKGDTLVVRAFVGSNQKIYESATPVIFRHQKALGTLSQPFQIQLSLPESPRIYSLSEVLYEAGSCFGVLDVQSSDNLNSEGSGLTYSIAGGADAGRFAINAATGWLSWSSFAPDVNNPADADGDNRYEVTVQVKDASNRTDQQQIIVTVAASAPPPLLVCPPNLTVLTSDDGTGNCNTATTGASVPAGTFCQSFNLTYQLSGATTGSGTGAVPVNKLFERGTTTVTYARTGIGAGQCSLTILVRDEELPAMTCPSNIVRNNDPGLCSAVISYAVTASDNCAYTVLRTGGLASGSVFPLGSTVNSYQATDVSGNTRTCSFTVAVNLINDPNNYLSYTVIGKDGVILTGNTVESGGVGVVAAGKKADLRSATKVTAQGTFVKSPVLDLSGGSQVTTFHSGQVNAAILPVFQYNNSPGNNDITIPDNSAPVTLTLDSYGTIQVGKNVTVTFATKTLVRIKELKLKLGSKAQFSQNTTLLIDKKIETEANVTINASGIYKVTCFAETKGKLGASNTLILDLYTLEDITIDGSTFIQGRFIGQSVTAASGVTWNWPAGKCPQYRASAELPDDGQASGRNDGTESDQLLLGLNNDSGTAFLFPNPASGAVWLDLSIYSGADCRIQLSDSRGSLIENRMAHAAAGEPVPFDLKGLSAGLYLIRVLVSGDKLQSQTLKLLIQ